MNVKWLPGILLAAATILAYQPAWHAGFIWDDDVYVVKNRLLSAPDGLQKIWFSLESPSQYCPLVYTTFRVERQLWGLNPEGYHWINILLHAANALLVARVLRRLVVPGAWLGAAMFALHPVNVESVAWISERKNVLSLFFYLLAMLAWSDFVNERTKPNSRCYVLALVLYALALLSKTTACTFPAAMLLVLWLKRIPITRIRLVQVAPFVALGLALGLLTVWWERYHQGTAGKLFSLGWLERILIASRAIFFYVGKLLWPVNLTFCYPRWNINPSYLMSYVSLLALVAVVAAIFWTRRLVGRSVETASAFYVASLSPLLGFIMLYTFRYTFVADHYQYIACIGPFALAGAGISVGLSSLRNLGRSGTPAYQGGRTKGKSWTALLPASILSGVLLLTLAILTWRQCRMYADVETLWRTTIARNPSSYLAHNNLGTTLFRQGRTEEAIAQFQKVIALVPEYEIAHYDLAHALLRQGKQEEAVAELRKAVELEPTYAKAHNNLANLLVRQGQPREALIHYETAFKLRPQSPDFANNLAWLLATCPDASIRDGPKAVVLAEQAERLSEGRESTFLATLAAAYAEAGRFPEAVSAARTAMERAMVERNHALVAALESQMPLYESGAPFHEETEGAPSPQDPGR